MKYRVVYTELVVNEVFFEGPEDLDEEDFYEVMDADTDAQIKRLDVAERQVSLFQKEPV